MKKTLIIAIVALVGLVIAGAIMMNYTTKELDVETITIENIDTPVSDAKIVKWEEEPKEEIVMPPTPEQDIQLANMKASEKEEKPKELSNRDKRRKEWESKMNDPEFMAKMKDRFREGISKRYQPLFEYLELSKEEQAGFTDIILNKMNSMKDIGREIFGSIHKGEISDEARQKFEKLNDEFASEVKSYLGEEVYDVYVQYEQTQPERKQVQRISGKLEEKNLTPLTTEQQDELVTAMYDKRKDTDVFVMSGFGVMELPSNESMSKEGRAQQAEQLDQLNEQYIETASTILDEQQLKEFSKNITHSSERQKRFLSGDHRKR